MSQQEVLELLKKKNEKMTNSEMSNELGIGKPSITVNTKKLLHTGLLKRTKKENKNEYEYSLKK